MACRALAPEETFALELLASELIQVDDAERMLEAAKCSRRPTRTRMAAAKWHLASSAIQLYEGAGHRAVSRPVVLRC